MEVLDRPPVFDFERARKSYLLKIAIFDTQDLN